jgi:hypothetical protein
MHASMHLCAAIAFYTLKIKHIIIEYLHPHDLIYKNYVLLNKSALKG